MNTDIQVSHCNICHATGYVRGLDGPQKCESCNGTGHIIQLRDTEPAEDPTLFCM